MKGGQPNITFSGTFPENITKQESPPAGNRKRYVARGVTSPRGGGGDYPNSNEGAGNSSSPNQVGTSVTPPWAGPVTGSGFPLARTCDRTGVIPPKKGHGTRGWEGTWDQRLAYPLPPRVKRQTFWENSLLSYFVSRR